MNLVLLPASALREPDGRRPGTAPWNGAAALAWHRAQRGGVTLFRTDSDPIDRPAASSWVGIVDDELLGDAARSAPNTSVDQLRALAGNRIRAGTFVPAAKPLLALLDRDGTIIVDKHYLSDPAGVELLPGAAEGLQLLRSAGVPLAVVSNQSGIARGKVTLEGLQQVHARMNDLLRGKNVTLDGIYVCPHAPDDRCECRKPAAGLAHQAANELGTGLSSVVVVGDKLSDLGLARQIGATAVLVTTGEGSSTLASPEARPDFVVDDLISLARLYLHPAGLPQAVPLPHT